MSARWGAAAARTVPAWLCGALAACSSFNAQWRAAENPAPGVSRWEGQWRSEKHTAAHGAPAAGKLRAVLTELHTPAGSPLRADFRAHWLTFASDYQVTLTPVPGSSTKFRGTHELPAIFGGTYRYTARIAGDHFSAHYDSSYDHGSFTLRRVPGPKDARPADSPH